MSAIKDAAVLYNTSQAPFPTRVSRFYKLNHKTKKLATAAGKSLIKSWNQPWAGP